MFRSNQRKGRKGNGFLGKLGRENPERWKGPEEAKGSKKMGAKKYPASSPNDAGFNPWKRPCFPSTEGKLTKGAGGDNRGTP